MRYSSTRTTANSNTAQRIVKTLLTPMCVLVLSGCGTSHLNCDTTENKALLKSAVNQLIDEYLNASEGLSLDNYLYPELSIVKFNQFIIDVNAKKCEYIVNADFKQTNTQLTNLQMSAVFRSTSNSGQTHALREFAVEPDDAFRLGRAAVKNSQ